MQCVNGPDENNKFLERRRAGYSFPINGGTPHGSQEASVTQNIMRNIAFMIMMLSIAAGAVVVVVDRFGALAPGT